MLTYREGDFIINGLKMHYYRTGGNKPPFLMLHGSSDSGLTWWPLAEWLSERFDVIMPDEIGHGMSDRLPANHRSHDMADRSIALIEHLNLKNPGLMGHSMGADTIEDLTLRYPLHPAFIILEDPIWQIQNLPGQETPAQLKRYQKMARAVVSFETLPLEELVFQTQRANPTWNPMDVQLWAESKKQFDTSLFNRVRDRHLTYPEFMTKTDCPTLLITSQWGIVTADVAHTAEKMWRSHHPFQWVRINDAGHNIRRDQLDQYKAAVAHFLEGL